MCRTPAGIVERQPPAGAPAVLPEARPRELVRSCPSQSATVSTVRRSWSASMARPSTSSASGACALMISVQSPSPYPPWVMKGIKGLARDRAGRGMTAAPKGRSVPRSAIREDAYHSSRYPSPGARPASRRTAKAPDHHSAPRPAAHPGLRLQRFGNWAAVRLEA